MIEYLQLYKKAQTFPNSILTGETIRDSVRQKPPGEALDSTNLNASIMCDLDSHVSRTRQIKGM